MDDFNFDKLLDEYESRRIDDHTIVKAKVVAITMSEVTLDIGIKQEAIVPVDEFYDKDGAINVKVGDEFEVYVIKAASRQGPVVSRKRAYEIAIGSQLKKAFESNEPVKGKIQSRTKDGYLVDMGVIAFLPASHSRSSGRDRDFLSVGEEKEFKIIKYDSDTGDVVVSIKRHAEDIREAEQKKTKEKLKVGEVFEGTVKNIIKTGIFVDIGGYEGYVNVKDISYTKIDRVEDAVKLGDKVKVKVLELDLAKDILKLGMKHLEQNPYLDLEKKIPVNTVLKGKISGIQKYGMFIEIAKGIDGFVHASEISWLDKRIDLEREFKVGQYVSVKVLKYDAEGQKISLSFRQVSENPWEKVASKYRVKDLIAGEVTSLTNFGVFVRIEDGIEGLVHISELTWDGKEQVLLKPGDMVECVILSIDPSNEKLSLSLKRKNTDPLLKFRRNEDVECVVMKAGDNFVNVLVNDKIEGFIYKNNISQQKVENAQAVVKKGDRLTATVINIDTAKRRLELSVKEYLNRQEKKEVEEHTKYSDIRLSIADLIKAKQEEE